MATTVRGGSSAGKEKRGTSPSSSLIKKSSKSSSSTPNSSTSSPTKEANSSPTDSKPVPNYLKPTISSNLDFSRLPKKSSTDASSQKPGLNRRRSFDRPPSVSQVQKAIRNVPSVNEMKSSLRSSSFSQKPSSAATAVSSTRQAASERPHLHARSTSSLKDSKPEPSMSKSRSLKKSTLSSVGAVTSKKDAKVTPSSSPARKKAPKSVNSESSVDYDNPSVDQLATEDELAVNIDSEVQSLPEISEMPDNCQELGDPAITEVEATHVEDVQDKTLPGGSDEHSTEHDTGSVDVDQVVEEAVTPENKTTDHKPEPETAVEAVETTPEPETKPEPVTESEEQNVTEVATEDKDDDNKDKPTVEPTEKTAEEKKEDTEPVEQEAVKASQDEAGVEDQSQSDSTPATPSSTTASPKPQPASAGKKDKQVYNDIIEETKTKLMGGRKNKVLALAGAFETVISLQDNNKN